MTTQLAWASAAAARGDGTWLSLIGHLVVYKKNVALGGTLEPPLLPTAAPSNQPSTISCGCSDAHAN
eukprot:3109193-Amphidinium_carterae.1